MQCAVIIDIYTAQIKTGGVCKKGMRCGRGVGVVVVLSCSGPGDTVLAGRYIS